MKNHTIISSHEKKLFDRSQHPYWFKQQQQTATKLSAMKATFKSE